MGKNIVLLNELNENEEDGRKSPISQNRIYNNSRTGNRFPLNQSNE